MCRYDLDSFIDCYIEQEITDEYIKLVIVFSDRTQHEEYHYSFPDKSKEWGISKTPPEDQLNVMVVLVDSLSHSMVQRSMKETYKYLSEHPRTVIMKVFVIVNIMLVLSGFLFYSHSHRSLKENYKYLSELTRTVIINLIVILLFGRILRIYGRTQD